MSSNPRISIALCTYNGEAFIGQQLESLRGQTLPPCELVVCDDASSDSTASIVKEFSANAPFPVRLFINDRNLGLVKNFSKTASLCEGDYVAFCDQDDIWLPDKLEAGSKEMRKAEIEYGVDTPLIVHSDLRLIDAQNRDLAPSYLEILGVRHVEADPLKSILVKNFVLGCTSLCNRVLINESLPFPQIIMNHDGWCAMIAASRGHISFIPEAKVLYRYHVQNATAWPERFTYRGYLKAFFTRRLPADRDVKMQLGLLRQAEILQRKLEGLSGEAPAYLHTYVHALRQGGLRRALAVMASGVRPPGIVQSLVFFYRIARGRHIGFIVDEERS